MRNKGIVMVKADAEFAKMLYDIKKAKLNTEDKFFSMKRITLAISRVPKLKDIVIGSKFDDDFYTESKSFRRIPK